MLQYFKTLFGRLKRPCKHFYKYHRATIADKQYLVHIKCVKKNCQHEQQVTWDYWQKLHKAQADRYHPKDK